MSWQDYVDNQLIASQCVKKAAIAGLDGTIWARSEGFEVSAKEKERNGDFPVVGKSSSRREGGGGRRNSVILFRSPKVCLRECVCPNRVS